MGLISKNNITLKQIRQKGFQFSIHKKKSVEGDLEVPLHLAGVDGLALGVDAGGDHIGPLVHVGEQERGADAGLGVESGAAVAVPASPNFEVERAVHSVLLRPEYRSQVLRHSSILL